MTGIVKTGGRIKGTPNKMTTETRKLLTCVLEKELKQIPFYLEQITDPYEKLRAILALLPFVLPKAVAPKPIDLLRLGEVTGIRMADDKEA